MCSASSNDHFAEPANVIEQFEQIRVMVESRFDVGESFVERGVPTFYVRMRKDSKEAFLELTQQMESLKLVPVLRKIEETVVLRVIPKPSTKPSRNIINIALFFATLGTVFLSGYFARAPPDIAGAVMFTGAIMAILGSHEMGHKLIADKHTVQATYPYFIPGLPPIGTFGAVIQQKSLPPNKDALFDLGFAGPIAGFIVSVVVALIGVQLSTVTNQLPSGAASIEVPLLFQFILMLVPPSGQGNWILLHPVAFAGWVGMVITMLNLMPVGMFDGGHVARSLIGKRAHRIVSYLGVLLLLVISWPMAFIALFFSSQRHPGALDDVSQPSTLRKLGAIGLIAVFILSVVRIFPLLG